MLFEYIRSLTIPFENIETYIPEKGKILDAGCGHGIFTRIMAENSPNRKILGIDPSEKKIGIAKSRNKIPNVTFKKAYLAELSEKFDCIVILDVLYLLPEKEKLKILKKAFNLLNPKGKMILAINGKGNGVIYKMLEAEEWIMTKALKITHTDYNQVYFESREFCQKALSQIGFKNIKEKKLSSLLPYPHILFVAEK